MPRVIKYTGIQDLPQDQRDAERQKLWRLARLSNPEMAEKERERNRLNKRAERKRKKEGKIQDLPRDQRDAERKKLWRLNRLSNPEIAEKERERNRLNKRAERKRKKEGKARPAECSPTPAISPDVIVPPTAPSLESPLSPQPQQDDTDIQHIFHGPGTILPTTTELAESRCMVDVGVMTDALQDFNHTVSPNPCRHRRFANSLFLKSRLVAARRVQRSGGHKKGHGSPLYNGIVRLDTMRKVIAKSKKSQAKSNQSGSSCGNGGVKERYAFSESDIEDDLPLPLLALRVIKAVPDTTISTACSTPAQAAQSDLGPNNSGSKVSNGSTWGRHRNGTEGHDCTNLRSVPGDPTIKKINIWKVSSPNALICSNHSYASDDSDDGVLRYNLGGCPQERCHDMVPNNPSAQCALEYYGNVIRSQEQETFQSLPLTSSICAMIKTKNRRASYLKDAINNKWPLLTLDFAKIPDRVWKMRRALDPMMFEPPELHASSVYLRFNEDIVADGLTLKKFAEKPLTMKRSNALANALPGYYGPKGKAIIKASLLRLYPPDTTPVDGFIPFMTEVFLEYFMVRYVGALLIQEDLDIDLEAACDVELASIPHGNHIHPDDDDDDEFGSIMRGIMREIRMDRQGNLQ